MKTIGIDAALAATGYAIINENGILLDWGVIETAPGDGSGADEFKRVCGLRTQISRLFVEHGKHEKQPISVAIERTDWVNSAHMGREAKARGALGLGIAAAYLACDDFIITPVVLGVREWMNLFGTHDKHETAIMVARCYSKIFTVSQPVPRLRRNKQNELTGALVGKPIVRTIEDGKRVPDHVTDAIAIALVAQRKIALEQRIGEQARQT
jgi:Holliday junction resolvasome RuvABC endonuclease subunit